jgi:threonine/homoserine/homoserine lactone efflux protein
MILLPFFVGFLVGLVMCIPVGPINIMVMNIQLKKNSPLLSSMVALGGSVMDFIYFFVILSGLKFVTFSSTTRFYFSLLGSFLIFILGAKDLFFKPKNEVTPSSIHNLPSPSAQRLFSYFILGIIIYTSNPTLILTMTALGAYIKGLQLFQLENLNVFLLSFGLALGSLTWFLFIIKLTIKFQDKIRERYLPQITKISGFFLILTACYVIFRLLYFPQS